MKFAPNQPAADAATAPRETIELLAAAAGAAAEEGIWLDVVRKMDEVYNDLLKYEVSLEEKNAALEDTQQFISSVLTSMSDLLIVCTRAGNIESVNQALATLLGCDEAALHGRPIFDLMANEDSRRIAANLLTEHSGEVVEECELQLLGANGSAIPVSLNWTPRYSGIGKMMGLVITGRPVGELRRAYQALRRAHDDLKNAQQQLVHSEKMASLGRLVAGVAHELNNPISFVFGNVIILKRYADRLNRYLAAIHSDVDEETREALRTELRIDRLLADLPSLIDGTVEGAERTRDIVDSLKRFSAVDRNEHVRFDLAPVIERAVQWVKQVAPDKFECTLDLPNAMELEGSPGQIQQVIMNLVQNAVDAATPDSGLAIARLEISAKRIAQEFTITFHDNGPGIAEAHMGKLFDPFFTTKPVGKGTGLGLAITYGIVERHGGRLQAANHPDGGAVFALTLPIPSESSAN
jgi:two-component system sensor histidine kinase HupT/HoxJ